MFPRPPAHDTVTSRKFLDPRLPHLGAMIAAAILLSSLAPAVSAAPYVMPPVAGVCTGNAGVGVGCGFDGSKSTAFGLTTAPKKSVLDIPWCDEKCYATCPPTYPIPYECEDCVYQDGEGKCFRNPYNVQSVAAPTQGGCYESKVADDTEHYDEMTKKHSSHSSGFFFHHQLEDGEEDLPDVLREELLGRARVQVRA